MSVLPGDESPEFPSAKAIVERILRVPNEYRSYTVPRSRLLERRQLPVALLDELVRLGVPFRQIAGEPHFDEDDISNVQLHHGLPSFHTSAMHLRARSLRSAATTPGRYEVDYRVSCPEPGHGGPCDFDLLTENGPLRRAGSDTPYRAVLSPPHLVPRFDSATSDLLREIAGRFSFFMLPPQVRGDADFARSTGLAECRGAAAVIIAEAEKRNIPCRPAFGLLLSPPFSIMHMWVEFLADGIWTAADPLLIDALVAWRRLDGLEWSPDRSPAPIMMRLASDYVPLVTHGGVATTVSLATRRIHLD